MRALVALAAFVALAALCAVASGSPAAPAQGALVANVGPGFEISLRTSAGARVTQLDPGAFTVEVDDQTEEHNFHLTGPGVNELTLAAEITKVTWNVTFRDGTYTFLCDVHPTTMRGRVTVGTPPAAPVAKPLVATVGPKQTISLRTGGGARVKNLKAGRYRITVHDRRTTDNLHLTGPGVNRRTGVKFRGTVTWLLSLQTGTYRYRSDVTRKLQGSFKVTA